MNHRLFSKYKITNTNMGKTTHSSLPGGVSLFHKSISPIAKSLS